MAIDMMSPMECFKVPIKWTQYVTQTDEVAYKEAIQECDVDLWSLPSTDDKEAKTAVRISLGADFSEQEAEDTRNRIFDVFHRAQKRQERTKGHEINFPLTLELLFPSKLNGFIIGTKGQNIRNIRENAGNITVYVDDGRKNPERVPEGFARLVMFGQRVEHIQAARTMIKELLGSVPDYGGPERRSNNTSGDEDDTSEVEPAANNGYCVDSGVTSTTEEAGANSEEELSPYGRPPTLNGVSRAFAASRLKPGVRPKSTDSDDASEATFGLGAYGVDRGATENSTAAETANSNTAPTPANNGGFGRSRKSRNQEANFGLGVHGVDCGATENGTTTETANSNSTDTILKSSTSPTQANNGGFGKSRKSRNPVISPAKPSKDPSPVKKTAFVAGARTIIPASPPPPLSISEETLVHTNSINVLNHSGQDQDVQESVPVVQKKRADSSQDSTVTNGSINISKAYQKAVNSVLDLGRDQVEEMAQLMGKQVIQYEEKLAQKDDKIVALEEENKKLKAKLQMKDAHLDDVVNTSYGSKFKRLCIKCSDEERAVAFAPCGHTVVCAGCADKSSICPSCKLAISRKLLLKF